MSWVKEALQGGDEEKRKAAEQQRAEELARKREAWQKASAQAEAEIQAEREKQEEIAHLKRLLDERGVPQLLADIRGELGGDIIYKQKAPSSDEYKSWAAYGLVHSVVGRTERYQRGDYETHHDDNHTSQDGISSPGGGWVDYTPFQRGKYTPITGFRIATGAVSTSHPRTEKTGFYVIAGRISATINKAYLLPNNRNWWFLKYFSGIPLPIRQKTELYSFENWNLSSLLPDGRINPDSFKISPEAEPIGFSAGVLNFGPDPIQDRERIRLILAHRIQTME